MKKFFLILLVLVGSFRYTQAQCPPGAFAFIGPYVTCSSGCGVLLKDWPEGVTVNIYGGSPIYIVTSVLIPGTYGGPGTGDAFTCVPCNIPLIFASIVPGATNGCVILLLGTVPVKLTDFNVTSTENKSLVTWSTTSEPGGTRYTLQRSLDARNFSDIITYIGKGNNINNYFYEDKQLLQQGNLYYRIKIVEVSGKITYSETVLLKRQSNFGISIYPNPAESDFKIAVPPQFLPASIVFYNADGKVVHSLTTMQPTAVINRKLPNGVYAVRITGKNNAAVTQTLLVR